MTDAKLQELVFVKPRFPEDRRPFWVRLLASIRFRISAKWSKGKVNPSFYVGGGADF